MTKIDKPYNFNQHKHNFAIWTAARAVQRGFTSTDKIKKAIEESDLRKYSEDASNHNIDDFETFHRTCSHQLITAFEEIGLKDVNYGRVAKIISIYLKTTVILCNKGICSRSSFIHPPIDRIILTNIGTHEGLPELKKINWTQLDEEGYWKLVSKIKSHFDRFDWTLEMFWSPERDN